MTGWSVKKDGVEMKERLLIAVAGWAERRSGRVLLGALVVTLVMGWLMGQLELQMHFKNLMPQDHPMVQEFNRVVDDFSTASMIIVAATGEEAELKRFADELAPLIEGMTEYVQRVEYRQEREFFLEHGFMLQKEKNLRDSKGVFRDLNLRPWMTALNDSFEKTYVDDEESIATKEKENKAIAQLDGIRHWLRTVERYAAEGESVDPEVAEEAAEWFLLGDEYLISQDKDMILLFAQPTFTLNEIDRVVAGEDSIDAVVHRVAGKYPSVEAGTTGTMALARDEMVAANADAYTTSLIAFLLIIALFILSFRMWVAPLLAGVCLLLGIIWAGGIAALTVGSLNIMTSMFAVILIGLGIDFSIHIISGYTENRAAGWDIGEALRQTLLKSGKGVITGGITTACAFFTLTVSETAGMREFGIVAGSGVICCMLAAIIVLPAMLSGRDRLLSRWRREKHRVRSAEFGFLGNAADGLSRRSGLAIGGGLVVTGLLLYAALQISFDYNYLNMEPLGLTSIELQDRMEEEFDVTPDFVLLTSASVEDARRVAEKAKDLKMVGMVTSISDYVPSREEQERRAVYLEEIRDFLESGQMEELSEGEMGALVDELWRLEDNIVELAQLAYIGGQEKVDEKCREIVGALEGEEEGVVGEGGDAAKESMVARLVERLEIDRGAAVLNLNRFQRHFEPPFRRMALGMTSIEALDVENLPKNIRDQFISRDGSKFLVTVYPREGVWKDLEFLDLFTRRMREIDERFTGIPSIFYVLMDIIAEDGKIAALLTVGVVFCLLVWDFRSLPLALLAMVPLVIGAVWMVGVMQISGLQLTLLNVIGVPLILGIGIDDGVHLLHRYRAEGAGKVKTVFTSTGKAVLLTSLTTMLAFGSLVFATYRGLGSMGIALFIGVGTCFFASVLLLPPLLGWLERREGGDKNE